MIYLFNKVYVFPESNFQRLADRVIIGRRIPSSVNRDTEHGAAVSSRYGIVHKNHDTLDELVTCDFGGSLDRFFHWLWTFGCDDRNIARDVSELTACPTHGGDPHRLHLHVNARDYWFIIATWYRHLHPTASSTSLMRMLTLVRRKLEIHMTLPHNSQLYIDDQDREINLATANAFATVVTDEFIANLPVIDMCSVADRGDVIARAPVEYHIAGYLLSGAEYPYRNALENKLKVMVSKTHVGFLCDTIDEAKLSLYLLPGLNVQKDTLSSWTERNPQFKFLADFNIRNDAPDYLRDNYDMDEVRDSAYVLQKLFGAHDPEAVLSSVGWLRDLSLDEIIEIELRSPYSNVNLARWSYLHALNSVTLSVLWDAHRRGDRAVLEEFALC